MPQNWHRVANQAQALRDDDVTIDFYNFTPDDDNKMIDAQITALHINRVFDPADNMLKV